MTVWQQCHLQRLRVDLDTIEITVRGKTLSPTLNTDSLLEETEKKNTLVATMLLFGANLGENKQRQAGALSLWLD